MLKIKEIRASKSNPEFSVVVFEQPVTVVEQMQGRKGLIKSTFAKPELVKSMGLKVGQSIAGKLISKSWETPQYEGHTAFDKTNLYYTTEFEGVASTVSSEVTEKQQAIA